MRRTVALTLALALPFAAAAHDGHDHPPPSPPPENAAGGIFPTSVGGPYRLTDQRGQTRTEADPEGRPQLVFFGYASCPGICSAVLPALAELADRLAAAGAAATPILITVDPVLDTVESLASAAAEIHPDLVALTGSPEALAAARDAFQVKAELIFVSPEYGPIYAHGSYVYLLDAEGGFLTLLPPILSPERMAEIVLSYL